MSQMQQYQDLIVNILDEGTDVFNKRTGSICKTIIGAQLSFDMSKGFPAITTRKLPFKSMVGELLGFFRGYTSAEAFRELNCKFWDPNANETKAWLSNPFRKGVDDLGDIYSKIWTDQEVYKVLEDTTENQVKVDYLEKAGYKSLGVFFNTKDIVQETPSHRLLKKNINQLEEVVYKIMTDPSDRRIVVNGWDNSYRETQSLNVCHVMYNFIPIEETKKISVVMTIRSWDAYLGSPINIASTALFLSIVARLTGYTADKVIIQAANVHLYENSFEVAKELVKRESYPSPKLILSDNIKKLESLDEIKACFRRIEPEDISLEGYVSHGVLTCKMIA